ncbi:MAG: TetR/AcrR family transcriptional regulator [Pseudomonadota bacterium]
MSPTPEPIATRDRFIHAASSLFAEKGFYGASMDQIAREVGLTKQALIHHFGSKEKLYGAVLQGISERLLAQLEKQPEGAASFAVAVERLYQTTLKNPGDTRLLMRELLDNRARAAKAGTWYLRPFLDGLAERLRQQPGWEKAKARDIAAHVYQILGAINFFAVSTVTLEQMYSAAHVKAMREAFPAQLRQLAGLTLN